MDTKENLMGHCTCADKHLQRPVYSYRKLFWLTQRSWGMCYQWMGLGKELIQKQVRTARSYCVPQGTTFSSMWYTMWKWKSLSQVWLFATPWTTQSMEFSRPEYWSGQPLPSPGESSQPRDWTQVSCTAGRFFTSWATRDWETTA